jgi:hypothetical protein
MGCFATQFQLLFLKCRIGSGKYVMKSIKTNPECGKGPDKEKIVNKL